MLNALSNARRRRLLLLLDQRSEPVSAGELATEIAARENGIEPNAVSCQQRKRVYIALTQHHLAILDEVGAIDYDEQGKRLTATEHTAALTEFLTDLSAAYSRGDDGR
ncbi:DUF7344 domain-containing protein [Halorubrum vacuolatum]|uniref:DUF7344 domain-containing protein n=1 Tax=Halorubrum vacuolatum TaxID=63740 RepID=UPI001C52EA53|nr:hypothetical protein [Halorubrum vacuolatum]